MPEIWTAGTHRVTLDGVQLDALTGALCIRVHWPYMQPAARLIAGRVSSDAAEWFDSEMSAVRQAHFEDHGIPWTWCHDAEAVMARRAATSITLAFEAEHITLAATVLRAAAVEFADRWWEFDMVASCHMEAAGITPADLSRWADEIEACLG